MKNFVYSCFAGMGKTTLAKKNASFIDLESSRFQWKGASDTSEGQKGLYTTKNPDWPHNYIKEIERQWKVGKNVLIAAQPEVLESLALSGVVDLQMVFPNSDLKEEYLLRYRERGNQESFIDLMDLHFEVFVNSMNSNKYAVAKVRVDTEGTFLSDIIGGV